MTLWLCFGEEEKRNKREKWDGGSCVTMFLCGAALLL